MFNDAEKERIRQLSDLLRDAERPVRVLSSIAWPPQVRERFFARCARELPEVQYPKLDPGPALERVAAARRRITSKESAVDGWLTRTADNIASGARMMASVGTVEFFEHGRCLFGAPTDPLPDEESNSLDLAHELNRVLETLNHVDLGAPAPACHLAVGVAQEISTAVEAMFGERAPKVLLVDELSSNALAGAERIRIRRNACFTDKDVTQLIHHEAYVHVATSLNGRAQPDLKILAASHPGTTRTQEGLAVFAEFISGSMELDRLRRLVDRVLAIQMAIEGADFLDVYSYFLGRSDNPEQSFENSRRVFRGGVLTGGAPFTKDVVYLDGLLRVHNFLRAVVAAGRSDCLRILFCGKLDIEDVPALCQLCSAGLCRPPQFLPPWAADLRFLLSHLAYSLFLNRVDMSKVNVHYAEMLDQAPVVQV